MIPPAHDGGASRLADLLSAAETTSRTMLDSAARASNHDVLTVDAHSFRVIAKLLGQLAVEVPRMREGTANGDDRPCDHASAGNGHPPLPDQARVQEVLAVMAALKHKMAHQAEDSGSASFDPATIRLLVSLLDYLANLITRLAADRAGIAGDRPQIDPH